MSIEARKAKRRLIKARYLKTLVNELEYGYDRETFMTIAEFAAPKCIRNSRRYAERAIEIYQKRG